MKKMADDAAVAWADAAEEAAEEAEAQRARDAWEIATWSSGPLPLLPAIRIWCHSASIAGAYFPEILEGLTRDIYCDRAGLADLIIEADNRVDWIARRCQPRGLPHPRCPEWDESTGTLEWRTSVVVRLAPHAELGMWEVSLFGAHTDRQAALEWAVDREARDEAAD